MARKKKRPSEKDLYPVVQRWLKRQYRCFAAGINTGLRYSRVDVFGLRDVGGDLYSEVESIVVEVKRGTQPFATASGQTLGYRVYANRVYLADFRDTPFTQDEIQIASHLGIGLIQIRGQRCIESLSSPYYRPLPKFAMALIEKLQYGKCQLCESIFLIGKGPNKTYGNVSRENLKNAIEQERGLMFWNREVAERKRKAGLRHSEDGSTFERRFICPDCIAYVFSQFKLQKE